MFTPFHNLNPTRHPYLFGGGISGALIASAIAAFVSMTALVSQTQLPGATSTILPSRPGSLTIQEGGSPSVASTPSTASAGAAGSTIPPSTLLGTGPLSGLAVGSAPAPGLGGSSSANPKPPLA